MKKLKPSAVAAESGPNPSLRASSLALAVAAALSAPLPLLAQNLPTGLKTLSGSVSVTTPTATSMNINQASQNANMSAQTFSIGFGNRVDVLQPNTSSLLMVNVVGNNPSNIFGTLTATGQLFLTNSAGVLFGPTASVNVGGLVASTMPISFSDATSGHYVFTNTGNAGSVVNQGTITALNGYVGLFAPNVINSGVISARMGSVALAAGNQVTLDMVGDGLIKVAVDTAALNAAVMNKGSIQADGGNVLLTARSANALLDTVINTDGVIRANTISNRNGTITLDGGTAGVVSVSGTVEAKGSDAGTTGGNINVLGQYVGVGLPGTTATVDASGDAGGGSVLIGGNFHGAGPQQNASMTYIGSGATILADAGTSGNGGQVAVWSDNGTQYFGNISVRGGAQSGDGGAVEVSGKHSLIFAGNVDTRAPKGRIGSLLLDPDEMIIDNTTDTFDTTTGTNPVVFSTTAPPSHITWATIDTQLGSTDVTVHTNTNDITVADTSAGVLGTNAINGTTLLLDSAAAININADVTSSVATNFAFTALSGGINLGANVSTAGGNIQFNNATTLTAPAPTVTAGAGNITFGSIDGGTINSLTTSNTGSLTLGGAITNMVNLTIQGGPTSVALPTTTLSGTLDVTTAGNLTESGVVTANTLQSTGGVGGSVNLGTQSNVIANLGAISSTGGFTLTNAGSLNITGAVSDSTGLASISADSGTLAVTTGSVAGVGVTLATTTSGDITLGGNVNAGVAGGNTATLTSVGTILQTGGTITADTLTGTATGQVGLTQANAIDR